MNEKLIAFSITMFVLSQISERVSNLLKLWLPSKWVGNLDIKSPDKALEKIRERKILLVSIFSGGLVAGIFLANGQVDEASNLAWVYNLCKKPLVFILIAIFLSFGSKFWHDLLDLLFLYKNAQRVIRTGEGLQASSADEISAMMAISSVQIARKALAEKKEWLMAIPGVVAVGLGAMPDDEPTIRVYYEDQSEAAAKVPSEMPWVDNFGVLRSIRIEKIVSGLIMAQSISVGGKVALEKKLGRNGTVGFIFRDKHNLDNIFISTCYHVLRPDDQQWGIYAKYPPDAVCHPKDSGDCGVKTQLRRGGRTDSLDFALAKLANASDLNFGSLPKVAKAGLMNQHYSDVRVQIITKNGIEYGYIQDWETKVEVHYQDGQNYSKQTFTDFFSIRKHEKKASKEPLLAVTSPGDSGAAVYFSDEALGMVVGASDKLTYAMKVTHMENNYGLSIYPHPDFS